MTEKYAKTDNPLVFFDTNILLYSIDENDKNKRAIATKILQDAANNKTGIISTQTLQEFFNIAIKKMNLSKEKKIMDLENRLVVAKGAEEGVGWIGSSGLTDADYCL